MAFATPQMARALGGAAAAAGAVGLWLLLGNGDSVIGGALVTLAVADMALLVAARLFKRREDRRRAALRRRPPPPSAR